jgi:hypothetical protein
MTGVCLATFASRRRLGALAAVAVLAGLAAVTGTAGTGERGGAPAAPAGFRLADGSAACRYLASGELVCRGAGAPAAIVVGPDGSARLSREDVGWDEATPVLLPAESWWHGSVSCRLAGDELSCTRNGQTVAVPRAGADATLISG